MAEPKPLSARDKEILDLLIAGKTEAEVAAQFGITQPRVNQIRHTPPALAYLVRQGGAAKLWLYNKTGAELLARLDWGGVKMIDLIAIWKAAMPQELTVKHDEAEVERAAERLAREAGITKDQAIRDIRDYMKAG